MFGEPLPVLNFGFEVRAALEVSFRMRLRGIPVASTYTP
jgi:hypothetical protein